MLWGLGMSEGAAGAELAGLAVEVKHLAAAVDRLALDVRELRSDVDGVRAIIDRGRGAWAIAAGLAGNLISKPMANFLRWLGPGKLAGCDLQRNQAAQGHALADGLSVEQSEVTKGNYSIQSHA
jgi:hypothetical protein